MRIKSKKPKGKKKNDERKKKTEVAMGGFERASQLPPAKTVRLLTTGPCDRYIHFLCKLISFRGLAWDFEDVRTRINVS